MKSNLVIACDVRGEERIKRTPKRKENSPAYFRYKASITVPCKPVASVQVKLVLKEAEADFRLIPYRCNICE